MRVHGESVVCAPYPLPINLLTMANLHNDHDQFVGRNLIDNSVIAHADSIEGLLRMELPSTHREGIFRKTINAPS